MERRQFIIGSFHHGGTVLDIGCANGFLLASFMSWCPHQLIPHGIEVDPSVYSARLLLREYASNFHQIGLEGYLASAHQSGFPSTFDFVYWNVWTNFHFNDEHNIDRLKQIIKLVRPSGRLVMGLHDSVESNESKVETLRFEMPVRQPLICMGQSLNLDVAYQTLLAHRRAVS